MPQEKKIVLIFTSADIWRDRKARGKEYSRGQAAATEYLPGIEVIYLETFRRSKSVLQQFGQVIYSKSHKRRIANKGVLLALALESLYSKNQMFSEVENLIVLTGRYQLFSHKFYESLIAESASRDFIGREFPEIGQVHTGLFMIKTKLLSEFLNTVNLNQMERRSISIENELWGFLSKKGANCLFLPNLDLYAPVFGTGIRDDNVF